QRRDDAVAEPRAALAARGRVLRVARAELAVRLRLLRLEIQVGPALEFAVVALAQRRVEHDAQPRRAGERRRRLPRAARAAAVPRPHVLGRKARSELPRLTPAVLGQRAVAVIPLDAALAVPLGLAVADQDEPRLSHAIPEASGLEAGPSRLPARRARRCPPAPPGGARETRAARRGGKRGA